MQATFISPATLRPARPFPPSDQPIGTPHVLVCAYAPISKAPTAFDMKRFATLLTQSQSELCSIFEKTDGKQKFCSDPWTSDTGAGNTRVLQQGDVFEKAGVNVSEVQGVLSESRAKAMQSRGRDCRAGTTYHAAALSFVFHAQSPFVPTLRGDVRVFATGDQFWAGGGVDLTIFYVDEVQIARFHKHWKQVCDEVDPSFYPLFKKQCDDYFYIPARAEYRGVGGIFYDDVVLPQDKLIDFQSRILSSVVASFDPIIRENAFKPWTAEQKRWQRIRRGRYLEFNLLEDRGVRFGLAGGKPSRTDSIMISAPPSIEWPYGYNPAPGSPEEKTLNLLKGKPRAWVGEELE